MQDIGGFCHLHHKGGAAGGQIVRCTYAGKYAIDRADDRLACRHVAADMGHQYDQRRLAHIGAFTAHVRAGNDQHSALGRQ